MATRIGPMKMFITLGAKELLGKRSTIRDVIETVSALNTRAVFAASLQVLNALARDLLRDFRKNGLRKSTEPRMRPPALMLHLAKHTTEAEVKAAAEYYAGLKYKQWIRVVETDSVVRTEVILGSMLAPIEGGGKEPLGQRIIETAEDLERVELRDSRVGFVAYVPIGSIKQGEALAAGSGGRTIQCAICHGKELKGLGDVPALAGRSPTYVFRQLYDLKSGARSGNGAPLMKAVVERLTTEDMIALAAYAASGSP